MAANEYYVRDLFRKYLEAFLLTPYEWGEEDHTGVDCSGLLCEVLAGVGRERHGFRIASWQLINRYPVVWEADSGEPLRVKRGCICGYGSTNVSHVMGAIDDQFCIGATGGTSATTDPEAADRDNAFVKLRPITYRRDLLYVVDPFKEYEP